ncbi:MAG TPA: response regulator [Chloroflexi bacterium]|jgi:two-component system response regulator (stage 0 sporulation protein F)|nr:response regulator [Chloroflexota bacterium]
MTDRPRILVVDDDLGIRETMFDILTLENYSVDVAASGEEAVERCRKERYDVALLDIRMPGMNGVETLRVLREIDPNLRVIMITGHEVGDLASEAMEAGAEAVFRKPLDVAMFLPMLLAATDQL